MLQNYRCVVGSGYPIVAMQLGFRAIKDYDSI